MKKTSRLLSLLLCSSLLASAQDTYWPLSGNWILNTSGPTASLTSQPLTPGGGFTFNGDHPVIFNSSAELLFTGGPNSNFPITDLGQILPIPTECKKYISLEIEPNGPPWGHVLRYREIDATPVTNNVMTTGFPNVGSYTVLHNALDAVYHGVVAARLNNDGSRYFYHMNRPASSFTCTLQRYTISPTGSVSGPSASGTGLPAGAFLKMSPDGETIGYIDENGLFVTYDIVNNVVTTYNTYSVGLFAFPQEIPAIECVKIGSQRYWFIGNASEMGFVEEGNTTYNKITSGAEGAKSAIALGRNGNLFYAYNSSGVSAGPGQLYHFNPGLVITNYATLGTSSLTTFRSAISGAAIATTAGSGANLSYLFGNQVAGEDINNTTTPMIPPVFNLNGASSGTLTLCTNEEGAIMNLILQAEQFGLAAGYTVTIEEGLVSPITGVFFPDGDIYTHTVEAVDLNPTFDVITYFPALAFYDGYIRITFSTVGPCGNIISTTAVFNIIRAGAVVEFFMIGPEDNLSGAPACVSHSFGGNTLPTPSHDGLQNRIPNIASVNVAAPPQPITTSMPPCADGWMGASSVGIDKGLLTLSNTTAAATNGYEVQVDEYDGGGTFIKTILHTFPASWPATGYRFDRLTTPRNYLRNNYELVKNNYYYRVSLSVNTDECGRYSAHSFFKILDGNPDGEYYKPGTTGIEDEFLMEQAHVFPNPANDVVNLSWQGAKGKTAHVALTNTLGQVVLQQAFDEARGANNQKVDVSKLAPGVYYYMLQTSAGDYNGKVVIQ